MAKAEKNKPKPGTAPKPAKANTGGSNRRWMPIAIALVVILGVTYAIYAPALNYGFTNWDDDVYVTENRLIQNPADTKAMFTTPVGGNYHPLTMYTLAWDYAATQGMEMEERGSRFHTVNLLFHLANTLLVFYFVYLFSRRRVLASIACALLFAIHPMHVESVAWVSERKDVLYAFFFFLSLIAYLFYLDKKKLYWLGLCLLAFILSVGSKPAAVILPLVLLAIDYYYERKLFSVKVIGEKVLFFAVSLAVGLVTTQAQKASGAVGEVHTAAERLLFPPYGTMMYFIKLLWPFHLSAVYPFPNIVGKGMGWEFYIAPVVVLLVVGGILYFGRKNRIYAFGLAFFFINVVLILQFFTVGQAIIAERYTYVAYLGLFMLLTWWMDDEKIKAQRNLYTGLFGVLILLSGLYVVLAGNRVKIWQTSETLWTDVIEKFPRRVPDAYNNRGYFYRHNKQPDKALEDYAQALAMNPTDEQVWSNRGNIYFDRGQYDSAILNYNRAISYKDGLWETLSNRGASRAQTGDLDGAIADLKLSVANEPTISSLTNMALVYTMRGEHEKAIEGYRRVVQLNPTADNIVNAIGVEYQRMARPDLSIAEFTNAIKLRPNAGVYYLNRSYSYNNTGNRTAAIQDMQAAQRLGVKVPPEYLQKLGL